MRYVIVVDLGGTQIRVGLADEAGVLHAEQRALTEAHTGADAIIERMVAMIEQARAQVPAGADLLGVGIGAPGPLDPFHGLVMNPPNLPGWHNVPLRALIEQRANLPTELGNDANAAALGEWFFGGGRGTHNLVYVTISTGIGGGVIADGKLLLGRYGSATEVGMQIIETSTRAFWEDLASGPGLARAAADAMIAEPRSLLHTLATPETVTGALVAQAAAMDDPLAQRLMDREGELIGIGLVNLLHLFSPELVLLGGGVAANNPLLIRRAAQVVQERAMDVYRDVPLRLATLGERVGLLGAAALFLHMREGRTPATE
ncbi:MAG TPA: ROK family protein [Roseiflexaceae bacterium]|nr:ROK family protein [Roseiflexaceae bacterium]